MTTAAVSCAARARDAVALAAASGAFVSVRGAAALAEAAELDAVPATRRGPLHGTPIAVKDNIDVAGMWTRCGTPGFGHHRAERDAPVVARLRAAGAVVIGKTRMHELAWGMVTPGCPNPRAPGRIAGGSSGGSAAAVAAGIVPIALGTDTGGSVRNPAALCGVVGVKTGVGQLPLAGVAPLAPTQDTVGVLASNATHCRRAIAALDALEPSEASPRRVGLLVDRWARRAEPDVLAAIDRAVERLTSDGVEIVEVSVRHGELAPATSYVTILAEAAREWWHGEGPPLGALSGAVRGQLLLGRQVSDADYRRALEVRSRIRVALDTALTEVDALLLPACPVTASADDRQVRCAGRLVSIETAHSAMTALASVSGLPAISVPVDGCDLPIGVQFIGRSTDTVCKLAEHMEAGDRR